MLRKQINQGKRTWTARVREKNLYFLEGGLWKVPLVKWHLSRDLKKGRE